jgi:hypothetical protein
MTKRHIQEITSKGRKLVRTVLSVDVKTFRRQGYLKLAKKLLVHSCYPLGEALH